MRNTGLDEAQAGIKTAERNINNLRYADDTTLMAESEEELKSLLMKVNEEVSPASPPYFCRGDVGGDGQTLSWSWGLHRLAARAPVGSWTLGPVPSSAPAAAPWWPRDPQRGLSLSLLQSLGCKVRLAHREDSMSQYV